MSRVVTKFPSFRERITIYSITETTDTYGGITTAEVSLGSAWAAVEKPSGSEVWRGGGQATEALWNITTWYRSDITVTPKGIIKLGSRTFDILDINDVENKHQYLIIACKEREGAV
jgi:SPP1 family predicted phage head-tail adaptor